MTAQEIFDKVVTHLRQQARRAFLAGSNSCAYRGIDGTKCAAGCLIEDNEYSPDMEKQLFDAVLSNESTPRSLVDRLLPHRRLIHDLQFIHDQVNIGSWEAHFSATARGYNLTYTDN